MKQNNENEKKKLKIIHIEHGAHLSTKVFTRNFQALLN